MTEQEEKQQNPPRNLTAGRVAEEFYQEVKNLCGKKRKYRNVSHFVETAAWKLLDEEKKEGERNGKQTT